MAIRRFDVADDVVELALGACNATGAWSMAWLLRPMVADDQPIIDLGSEKLIGELTDGNLPGAHQSGSTRTATGDLAVSPETGEWGLWVITKAAGTTAIRWHFIDPLTKAATHANDNTTIGNPSSQAGGSILIANGWTPAQVDIAALALWAGTALSDEQVEQLAATDIKNGWEALSPSGLWPFDQPSVEAPVTDLTGNGADEVSRTGTTILGEDPPIPYEAAPPVEASASGEGISTSSASATCTRLAEAAGSGVGAGAAEGSRSRFGVAEDTGTGSGTASGEAKEPPPTVIEGVAAGTGAGAAIASGTVIEVSRPAGTYILYEEDWRSV